MISTICIFHPGFGFKFPIWRAALVVACLIGLVGAMPARAAPSIAVDVASGRVISHQDAFQRWYPASLTKLMTIYVTFRALREGRISLDTDITMSSEAASQPASKMYFKPGQRFPLDSALKYLMVKSANDIAVAIAQAVGVSTEAFVSEMNRQALKIGMTSSRFVNPNGLPGEGQYTTARDLALLGVTLRQEFPEYSRYFNLEGFSVYGRGYENFNILIGRFDGANGMKTGYICASGFNQVSSATRNGRTVVAVVLGADGQVARAEKSAELLEKALTTTPGSDTLLTLAPYGESRDQVKDISDSICSPEARKDRREARDEKGKLVFHSPLIKEFVGKPELVAAPVSEPIGSGPATAEEAALILGTSRIPLPDFKPAT